MGNGRFMSKIFDNIPTVWAAAPVLFKIPSLRPMLENNGTFPAGKAGIVGALHKGRNAAVIIDGIAGMFYGPTTRRGKIYERLWLKNRKAICAIALQCGVDIVPAYCFGTNDLWSIAQDPFGILRKLSIYLDISLTPGIGRFGIPMALQPASLYCWHLEIRSPAPKRASIRPGTRLRWSPLTHIC